MPELPEVETIARDLAPKITGRRISSVRAAFPGSIDPRGLPAAALEGDSIVGVGRIGKYVVLSLASGRTLAIHLRMTGRLIVDPPHEPAYTRVTLHFADGGTLAFAFLKRCSTPAFVRAGRPAASTRASAHNCCAVCAGCCAKPYHIEVLASTTTSIRKESKGGFRRG